MLLAEISKLTSVIGRHSHSHMIGCESFRYFLLTVVLFFSGLSVSASTVSDSLRFRVIFLVNSSTVQTELFDNDVVLSDFAGNYNALVKDELVSDLHLTISGSASVEGHSFKNHILAGKRAQSLLQYLKEKYSIPDSAFEILTGAPAAFDMEAVFATFSKLRSDLDFAAIRRITETSSGLELKSAFKKLDGCDEGPAWTWYKQNILDPSRFAEIWIYYNRTVPEDDIATASPVAAVAPLAVVVPETPAVPEVPVVADSTQTAAVEPEESLKNEFRIGTNLLYDIATVANISFECGFARHLAVNILATYSPWDIKRPDVKIRTLIFQPELRWYFADNFRGHYVGVEGHYGWYNVALGGRTRYQDRDGNTPLWGAGISYGYVLPFNKHWGMDFGISAGYANLIYDCFYNIENGAKFTTMTRDWWGPTRVGISIYYQF